MEAAEQDTPQLRIAWQYRRYIQRQQVQQQSGLPSLQEDAVMPGIPSLQSGSLGRLTSAPARSKTPCNCKCNDRTTMGSSQLDIHGVTVQWNVGFPASFSGTICFAHYECEANIL